MNKCFINDVFYAIPFNSFKEKRNIMNDLEQKKRRGFPIYGLEVDENRRCIIYREPNCQIHNQ